MSVLKFMTSAKVVLSLVFSNPTLALAFTRVTELRAVFRPAAGYLHKP